MDARTGRKGIVAAALLAATALPAQAVDRFVLVLEGEEGRVAVEVGSDGWRYGPRHYVYYDPGPSRCDYSRPGRVERHHHTIIRETTVVRETRVVAPVHRHGRWDGDRWDDSRGDDDRRERGRPGWSSAGYGSGHGKGQGRGHGNGWKTRKAKW
ncbi:MAG: hypothetical protein AB1505_34000 [Candidatus Latescibacterota bacterium]